MRVTSSTDLPRKTARVPFSMLPSSKLKYARLRGRAETIVRVEPDFSSNDQIIVDQDTCTFVGNDAEVEFIDDLPVASSVTVVFTGPYRPTSPEKFLLNLPFKVNEKYRVEAYTVTIIDSSHEEFIVGPSTEIRLSFVQELKEDGIMSDVYEKLVRALAVVGEGDCPKGILFVGPPGSGKTFFLKKLVATDPKGFITIGPNILSLGQKSLQEVNKALASAANDEKVVIMDDFDELLSKLPPIASLLASFFDSDGTAPVVLAAQSESSVSSLLRSPCKFGVIVRTRLPTLEERRVLLKSLGIDDAEVARHLEGYSPGDILKLVTIMKIDGVHLDGRTLREYKKKFPPASIMNYTADIPDVRWEHIGGLERVKKTLQKVVEWPIKYPELFEKFNIDPPRGILLYGPPGTGKTLLARAVATESGANFIYVSAPEILDKYYGVSEERIKEIFQRARESKPAVIFIDEIDAIGVRRGSNGHGIDSIINQLLVEMDGITKNDGVIVIAATNRPDVLDPALLRPGRFEKQIEVPLPDARERVEIFRVHLRDKPVSSEIDCEQLAYFTEGFSGAQIEAAVREAAYRAIERAIKDGVEPAMTMKDLLDSITAMRGVVNEAE